MWGSDLGFLNYCMWKQGYEGLSFEHGMQTCLDNLKVLLKSELRAEFSDIKAADRCLPMSSKVSSYHCKKTQNWYGTGFALKGSSYQEKKKYINVKGRASLLFCIFPVRSLVQCCA